MNNDNVELLDDDTEEIKPIPTIPINQEYLQPIPPVSMDIINDLNKNSDNNTQLITTETVSNSVGYSSNISEKNNTVTKPEPKLISPEDVLSQVGKKQPQMISPEAVLQQVGNNNYQTTLQNVSNIQKNVANIQNIKSESKKISEKNNNQAISYKNYIPTNYQEQDEFKEYKKLNKDYRILLLFIAVIILFTLGIITSITGKTELKKENKTKLSIDTSYIIENESGNAYFFPPIENKVKEGNSDETTYYILGEEKSGQSELFEKLSKKYGISVQNQGSPYERVTEIGPIKKEKKIWLIQPTDYTNLNERIIKASNKDGSIIVIKGSNGITSKVEEHLRLLNQLGAEKTIIFINKDNDSVDIEKIRNNIKKLIKKCGYDSNTPIVVGDVNKDETITELDGKMKEWIDIVESNKEKELKAYVNNVIENGNNTQIILQIENGKIKVGDSINLLGENYSTKQKVEKIYINNKSEKEATSDNENDEVTIEIDKKYEKSIKKAKIITTNNDIHDKFNAIFYYNDDNNKPSRAFANNYTTEIQLYNSILAKITIPKDVNYVVKKDTTNISVELNNKIPLFKGQQFTIYDQVNNVFGYGEVTEIVK